MITNENKNLGRVHEERIIKPNKQSENLDGDAVTSDDAKHIYKDLF